MQIAARLLVSAGTSVAILAGIFLSGCTSSHDRANPSAPSTTLDAASSSASRVTSSPTKSSPPPTLSSARTTKPTVVQTSSIVIPPNLCAATDKSQDTADAYMGSLSAGHESPECIGSAATASTSARDATRPLVVNRSPLAEHIAAAEFVG
jgi:hypothetical protein